MPEHREMSPSMRAALLQVGFVQIMEAPPEALDDIIKALVDILKACQDRATPGKESQNAPK